jgi:hypothetical protein
MDEIIYCSIRGNERTTVYEDGKIIREIYTNECLYIYENDILIARYPIKENGGIPSYVRIEEE